MCVDVFMEEYGFTVRAMNCRRTKDLKVGAENGLTWKLEVPYPEHSSNSRTPTDDEALLVAKLIVSNHPECHKVF